LFENLLFFDAATELFLALADDFGTDFLLLLKACECFWVDAVLLASIDIEIAEKLGHSFFFVHPFVLLCLN
jgi:hypothetical protein